MSAMQPDGSFICARGRRKPDPAPIFDAAGRQAVICGACSGSGLVPEGSIAVAGDIARPGDRCKDCDGSGISRWAYPSDRTSPHTRDDNERRSTV